MIQPNGWDELSTDEKLGRLKRYIAQVAGQLDQRAGELSLRIGGIESAIGDLTQELALLKNPQLRKDAEDRARQGDAQHEFPNKVRSQMRK